MGARQRWGKLVLLILLGILDVGEFVEDLGLLVVFIHLDEFAARNADYLNPIGEQFNH